MNPWRYNNIEVAYFYLLIFLDPFYHKQFLQTMECSQRCLCGRNGTRKCDGVETPLSDEDLQELRLMAHEIGPVFTLFFFNIYNFA